MVQQNWHSMDNDEVLAVLDVSPNGLTQNEIHSRMKKYGPNELEQPEPTSAFLRFLSQYNDPLNYLLIAAALVALAIKPDHPGDAIFIFLVLTANAFFGFWQEGQAEQAMDALKQMSISNSVTLRDGFESEIPTTDLVPGDIVKLEEGINVPADLRLLEVYQCRVDESALTGESEPITKMTDSMDVNALLSDRKNMMFMGTTVATGRAVGVVVETGMSTQLGRIASDISEAKTPKTPLELKLESLGRFLGFIALIVAVLLVSIKLILAYGGTEPLRDVAIKQFITAIAIFVAIVPEGLPIILVITLALGMRNMARHKAIIRRMKAVETLGSTTVICSDKTGTLTKNEMTVRQLHTVEGYFSVTGDGFNPKGTLAEGDKELDQDSMSNLQSDPSFRLLAACLSLCHNSQISKQDGRWSAIGDPTDSACAVLGWKLNGDVRKFSQRHPRLHEFFFDTDRKRMSVIHEYEGERWVFAKGAAGGFVPITTHRYKNGELVEIVDEDLKQASIRNKEMGSQSMRVLALAARKLGHEEDITDIASVEKNLTFLGLVGIMDPPRPEVKEAIRICQDAGIKVKMITGDHHMTASAIGQELSITGAEMEPVSGSELRVMSDDELSESVEKAIFSRVTPDQKMRIVSSLQDQGEIVAMTGDGVNDAPALSGANIGIAMGIAGTDVAKDAADMVLQDDNFANIVHAVEEGRKIYQNIRNFVRYQVSTNVAAVALIVISTFIFGWELPLTATQILVINILMDGPPAVALGVEKRHGNVMSQPPRPVDEGLPSSKDIGLIFYLGAVMVIGTLIVFYLAGGGVYGNECTLAPFATEADAGFSVSACLSGDEAALAAWSSYAESTFASAQTMTFAVFIVYQLFNVLNCRSEKESLFSLGLFSNRAINYAILASGFLLFLFVHFATFQLPLIGIEFGNLLSTTPLEGVDWLVLVTVASTVFLVEEFRKFMLNSGFFKVRR
ncbi:MAG: cation-transporting P-type ATPase [Candidatus Thermoplasmatota archaeon]|nr:cation-transporting P-type ATPase [Candidatus Thermoplasmatota archaeon]